MKITRNDVLQNKQINEQTNYQKGKQQRNYKSKMCHIERSRDVKG
ncbi:hypothetical protein [Kordia aestuariivivens]|nr:hypothetical protein [Kordia aestuariivivens]